MSFRRILILAMQYRFTLPAGSAPLSAPLTTLRCGLTAQCDIDNHYQYCIFICGSRDAGRSPGAAPVMSSSPITPYATTCCIVGGGPRRADARPAGAGGGSDVTVLEKHADFLRDFRGDTIHPSTLEVMHQLGLLDELLTLPHQRAESLHAEVAGRDIKLADFTRLPTRCKFIAFMPQWEFLNFLAQQAAAFPNFRLC